jgi:glycosyltransferase involved in cell wall biosynthesis
LLWIPWRRYVARAVEAADAIHAASPREAWLVESHYPQSHGKTVVIPNGVEEDVFGYKWRGADSDYMMYAGRVEKYKRLEVAVDLARELGLRLLVVGRGAHREKLRRYTRRRRAGPRRSALHRLLRAQGDGLRRHCRRCGAGALYAHRREMRRGGDETQLRKRAV